MSPTIQSPEAIAALERQLSDPSRKAEAARALVAAYRAANEAPKLLSALEALAGSSPDFTEKAGALKQAAKVHLEELKQPDLALTTAARALPFAPTDQELFAIARQAADQAGMADTWADILNDLLEKAPRSAQAPLHRELAELQERLGDGDEAMNHLRQAVEADPLHAATLETLLRIYRGREQWVALAETLEKASRALPDKQAQLACLREAASVHELELEDRDRALDCWRELVKREPTDKGAALALERLAADLDRPKDLAAALQAQRMTEGPGPADRDLAVRLAQVKLEKLGEARGALDLCELVLNQDGAHAGARQVAEACALKPGPEGSAALAMLDRRYMRHADHDARVALRERRLVAVPAEEKSALFAEIRDLCEKHLHQPERAFLAGLKVFTARVDRERLRPELERLAEATDSLEELAEVFEETTEELMPGDALSSALCRSAATLREKLGQHQDAARMWNELLAECPGDREALEHLAKIYESSGDARGLAEACTRKAKLATDPAERAALLEKAGSAHEATGEDATAIEDYRAALAIRTSAPALAGLDRIYGRAHKSTEQADVLEKLVALAVDPSARRVLRLRLAKLLEGEGRGPAALRVLSAMLNDAGARGDEEAVAGLQRLLDRDDVCLEAAALLEGVWRRSGNSRGLAEVLALRAERAVPPQRADLLIEVAGLREKLGEHEAAFEACARAFRDRPADALLRSDLERAAEASGAFDALVGAYEAALEAGAQEPLATELWRRVAALYTDRLKRPELAIRALTELSRRSPDDASLLRRIVEVQRGKGGSRQLAEALGRLAALESEVETKVELLFEAAQVAEESLGDKGLAIASYRRVLSLQPDDRNSIKLLERLLGETGQHEALATLLEQDARLSAEDKEETARLQTWLARLKARELGDPRGAVRLLAQVLGASPFHRGASELIAELAGRDGPAREDAARLQETMLEGGGDDAKLVATLEARLAAQPAHFERVVILRKLAVVRARRQGSPELGFLAAAQALRAAPGDGASLQLCLELATEASCEEDLGALLAELAPLAIGSATRASLFRALAHLQLEAGEDAEAERSLHEVLEVVPGDREASDRLEALYTRLDRPCEHVALLRRRLSGTREPHERLALLRRIADLWVKAGDEAAAADALREAWSIEPGTDLLARLEVLLGRLGRFEEQAEVLHRLADAAAPQDAREPLLKRAAALLAAKQGELAAGTFGQVLAHWPGDPEAVAGLEKLLAGSPQGEDPARAEAGKLLEAAYKAKGDSRRYVEMLEQRLEGSSAAERSALLEEIAEVREDLGEAPLAFAARRRLFAEAPDDEQARTALERLAADAGLLEELLGVYEDTLDRGAGPALSAALWRRIAQIRSEQLPDREAAAAAWEQVAKGAPADATALTALEGLYRALGDPRRLAGLLARRAELEPSPEGKAARLHEAAQIARDQAGDEATAARCWQRVLEFFPEDRRALDALHGILSTGGQHGALAQVLEREIALASARGDTEAAVSRRLDLARIRLDYLDDAAGAFALWAEVLRVSPGHAGTLDELEKLALSNDRESKGAAALLEPALESHGDAARLVRILEAHAAAVPAGPERAALLAKAADACRDRLRDGARAFVLAARALREEPAAPALLARCRELAVAAGMQEELVALLEELSGGAGKIDLLRALAAEQERAGEDAEAKKSWQRVLEAEPGDAEALSSLEALVARGSGWTDLVALLERRLAATTDPKEICALWMRIAEARQKAGDESGAAEALRDAFAVGRAPEALEALEQLLGGAHRFQEQAEVLGRLAELVTQPERRRQCLVGRAEALRQAGLSEPAMDAYQEAFALGGADDVLVAGLEQLLSAGSIRTRAAAQLEEVYRARGDRAGLVRSLEVQIAAGVPGRAQLLLDLAQQREELGEKRAALSARLEAFADAPHHQANLEALDRLARAQGALAEVADALRTQAAREGEGAPWWRPLARLEEELGRGAQAAEAWEQVRRAEPENLEALRALARLIPERGNAKPRAAVLEALSRLEPEAGARQERLLELAALAEGELGDGSLAERCYREVLSRSPDHPVASARLGEVLLRLGSYEELDRLLLGRVDAARARGDAEEAVRCQLELARLEVGPMASPLAALELVREVLQEKPAHPGAIAVLEELLRSAGSVRLEAAAMLEPLLSARGSEEKLAEVLEVRAAAEPNVFERAELWRRLSELYGGPLGKPQLAFTAASRILRELPDDPPVLDRCLAFAEAAGARPELIALIEEVAPRADRAPSRAALYRALADLRGAETTAMPAFEALAAAFRADPDDPALDKRLAQAAEACGAFSGLAGLLEQVLPRLGDPARALATTLWLGRLYEEKLAVAERAVVHYEKARAADPAAERTALPALARLYEKLGRWAELATTLEELAARTEDEETQIQLLSRLGALAQEKLEDPRRAIGCFERVLQIDGSNLAALRALEWNFGAVGDHARLLAVLERERDKVAGAEREAVRLRMAEVCETQLGDRERAVALYREVLSENWRCAEAGDRLEALLGELGRPEELRALLVDRVGRTLDRRELTALHERLGELAWRTLRRPDEAVGHFCAALEREPKHERALQALRALYAELGRKGELVAVLRRLAAQQDGAAAKETRLQLAELLEGPGGRAEALEAGRAALAAAPHSEAELARLRQIFVSHQGWADAARVLEARVKARLAAGEAAKAVEDLFEEADVWGRAGDPLRGALRLEQVLEVEPGNRKAYEAAKAIYAAQSRWAPWARLVSAFLPRLAEDSERLAALVELSDVQNRRLGEPRPAFDSACLALRLAPGDAALLDRVCGLADAGHAHAELDAVLLELAGKVGAGEAAARLGLRLSELRERKLGDYGGAAEALRRVLAVDPGDVRALDALAAVCLRRGQFAEHVVALEGKVAAVADAQAKKALLSAIAKVREEKLHDPVGAAEALRRSIELAPDEPAWRELAELQRRQGDWPEVARSLLALRDLAGSTAERARLQLEVAGLRERELRDDEAAIADYRAALELDPRSRPALEALERLYARHDRPRELLSVHEKQLAAAPSPAERVKLLFACAALHEGRLGDPARADDCLESVLALEPRNLVAITGLESLRRAQGRFQDLALVLERHVPLCPTPAEQASLSAKLGELYRDQLKDADRAVSCFQRALALDPKSRAAAHALTGIFEQRGAWARVGEMLQREAELSGGEEAVELFHRAGRLLLDKQQSPQLARAAWQRAQALAPGHVPTLRALQALFKQEGDWDRYEQALVAEAEHSVDPAAKGQASLEVAKHLAGRRKDEAGARKWYEAALRLLPESLEAAAPLADLAVARADWADAERLLGVVTRQLTKRMEQGDAAAVGELGRQLRRLGQACRQGGRRDEALIALREASSLDPNKVEVLEDLGSLLVEMGRFEDALEVTQRLLERQAGKLTNPALATLRCRLADLYEKTGEAAAARAELDQALKLDPLHEPALRARVRLADQAGAWKESVELRGRLAHALKGQARLEAFVELGDVARDRLADLAAAADAYLQALAIKADELAVMERLAGVYRQTRQWHQAVKTLTAMLAHPRVLEDQRKRLYLTLGEVAGGEMADLDRAVAAYNSALDLDPAFQEAFRALEELLRRRKRHKLLDESYTRQLQRLPETDRTRLARAALWRAMGELRARDLRDEGAALAAFLASAELTPDDAPAQEALATFASRVPGNEEVARTAWRRALPGIDDPSRACEALGELALVLKDPDSAHLAWQAFDGLVDGAAARDRLAQKLPRAATGRPMTLLTDRLWQRTLFDPDVRGPVGELMGILAEQAGPELGVAHSKLGINPKKHGLDPGAVPQGVAHAEEIRHVTRLLGMESADLFAPFLSGPTEATLFRGSRPAPDQDVDVEVCATHPPCLKLGGRFFAGTGLPQERAAQLAFYLAFLRPELALARMVARERVEPIFQAAVSLADGSYRCTADDKAVSRERKLLKKALSEQAMVALSTVVRQWLPRSAPDDLQRWLTGAELTAARAALLAAGEVAAFKRVVLDGRLLAGVDVGVARRRLLGFALGGDLHALRVALGAAA